MGYRHGKWFWNCKITLNQFADWLNRWGDEDKHVKYQQKEEQKAFRRGYHQAMRDVFDKLGLDYKIFDKRAKSGYRNEKQEEKW